MVVIALLLIPGVNDPPKKQERSDRPAVRRTEACCTHTSRIGERPPTTRGRAGKGDTSTPNWLGNAAKTRLRHIVSYWGVVLNRRWSAFLPTRKSALKSPPHTCTALRGRRLGQQHLMSWNTAWPSVDKRENRLEGRGLSVRFCCAIDSTRTTTPAQTHHKC